MIIVTIGNVKLKFDSMESAVNAVLAVSAGCQVEEEYRPYPEDRVFHPAMRKLPTLEIAKVCGTVVPWTVTDEGK